MPLVLSLMPLMSVVHAEFMANEVPGVQVPPAVVERMCRAPSAAAAAAEGIAIASEVGQALRGRVQGIHVVAPDGRIEPALAVVEALQ